MKSINLILILLIVLISCKEKQQTDDLDCSEEMNFRDSVFIETKVKDYLFVKGNPFNYLSYNNDKVNVFFDKNYGELTSVNIISNTLDKHVNFDFEGDELLSKVVYYKDEKGNKTTSEIIQYKNGIIDYKNSDFINIEKKQETATHVEFQVDYISGYTFIKGTVYAGKKMYFREDTLGAMIFPMNKKSEIIKIPKEKIKENLYNFSLIISRGLDKDIRGVTTYPGKGETSFSHLFIKEVRW